VVSVNVIDEPALAKLKNLLQEQVLAAAGTTYYPVEEVAKKEEPVFERGFQPD
jgi:hypothetical protein